MFLILFISFFFLYLVNIQIKGIKNSHLKFIMIVLYF